MQETSFSNTFDKITSYILKYPLTQSIFIFYSIVHQSIIGRRLFKIIIEFISQNTDRVQKEKIINLLILHFQLRSLIFNSNKFILQINLLTYRSKVLVYVMIHLNHCYKAFTCSFSSTVVSLISRSNWGADATDLCKVTVKGSEISLGRDRPTAFWALTLNW